MKHWSSANTLRLHRPSLRAFGLALVYLCLLFGIGEASLRLFTAAQLIPKPYPRTRNAELDLKLALLEARYHPDDINCIILGSSQTDQAVDPSILSKTYHRLSGKQLNCFNFSIGTLTAESAAPFARLVLQRYPGIRLLYYGTSARDYSSRFGELSRPVLVDPWVRYNQGLFSLPGWLMEHTYFYRALSAVAIRSIYEYAQFEQKLQRNLTPNGYLVSTRQSISDEDRNFIPEYKIATQDQQGLRDLLALNTPTLQVIVFEVPVHPNFLPHYVEANPDAYEQKFIEPIRRTIQKRGIPFWRSQDWAAQTIPDSGWSDLKHLNQTGGALFSQWLAQQTFSAVQSGAVRDPFAPAQP